MKISAWFLSLMVSFLLACGGANTGNGTPDDGAPGDDLALDADLAADPAADDPGTADEGIHFADLGLGKDLFDPGPRDDGPVDVPPAQICTNGTVKGITCAPNEQATVAFAKVTLDITGPCTDGKIVQLETESDETGNYQFTDVPAGEGTLNFQRGSYKGMASITVEPGQVTDLTGMSKRCFKTVGAAKLAVVKGDSDRIETLLDGLMLEYDAYDDGGNWQTVEQSAAFDFLTDPVKLMQYDVIFINCSVTIQAMLEKGEEIPYYLRSFVAAGKSLYASDWAWLYVEKAFPDAVAFAGVDDSIDKGYDGVPDNQAGPRQGPGPTLSEKKAGAKPLTFPMTFVDEKLAAVMAKPSSDVYFDLGTWVVMDGKQTGVGTEIEVTGAIPATEGSWGTRPLVVSFQPEGSKGRIIYTSFHNIAQEDAQGSVEDIQKILSYLVFSL